LELNSYLYNIPIQHLKDFSEDELIEFLVLKKKNEKQEKKEELLQQKSKEKPLNVLSFTIASAFSAKENIDDEDDIATQIEWLQQGLRYIKHQYIKINKRIQ
jgi:hypothetical protein